MTTDTNSAAPGLRTEEPVRFNVDGKDVSATQPHPHLLSGIVISGIEQEQAHGL